MSYFPKSVYATVFAPRQAVELTPTPPLAAAAAAAAKTKTKLGLRGRIAQLFARKEQIVELTLREPEELFEYHNPALGVRELRAEG